MTIRERGVAGPTALPLTTHVLAAPIPVVHHPRMPNFRGRWASWDDAVSDAFDRVVMYEYAGGRPEVHFLYGVAPDGTAYTHLLEGVAG